MQWRGSGQVFRTPTCLVFLHSPRLFSADVARVLTFQAESAVCNLRHGDFCPSPASVSRGNNMHNRAQPLGRVRTTVPDNCSPPDARGGQKLTDAPSPKLLVAPYLPRPVGVPAIAVPGERRPRGGAGSTAGRVRPARAGSGGGSGSAEL